ncbi:MAG: Leucine-, isoleucine-, valine-, threonine-, and alanine-binding protein precursor [Syntrophorhabdus sp. PtaU1.Bin153]|nr:MAG: Leucine-, isoleucine-, valine-, threonine-, and alanine-binding protein precursor [Syntrophorhabdus sp. PtaU1.Bin153]
MKNLTKHLSLLVPILFMLLFSCSGSSDRQGEMKMGAILPLTGDAAGWGQSGKEGIDLAVSEINGKGGISGKKIVVIYEDTQAQPEKGASAMLKLATVDKVPVVIGDLVSATTLAAAPIAEQNKVVLLSPTASAPKLTDAGKFVFRIWPSDLAEGVAMADFAANNLKLKKVAILYIQNDYGVSLKDVFEKQFTKNGGEVVETGAYKQDESDFRPYLERIMRKKPEAVYLVSYYKDAGLALKQAKQLRIKVRFLGTTAIQEPKLFEVAGDAAEGLIYAISSGYDPKSQDEKVKEFNIKFKDKFGKEPSFVQAQCYDAVAVVASAVGKDGFKSEDIQKRLETIKDYHGVTGLIAFDENGDVKKPTAFMTVKGKEFVPYGK